MRLVKAAKAFPHAKFYNLSAVKSKGRVIAGDSGDRAFATKAVALSSIPYRPKPTTVCESKLLPC